MECIPFWFCTEVLCVNWSVGFFGWLSGPHWTDIPGLPGHCETYLHSMLGFLNRTPSAPRDAADHPQLRLGLFPQPVWSAHSFCVGPHHGGSAVLYDRLPRKLRSCYFSAQFSRSVVSDFLQPTDYGTLGFPVHHQPPGLAQTCAHRVGDAILTEWEPRLSWLPLLQRGLCARKLSVLLPVSPE